MLSYLKRNLEISYESIAEKFGFTDDAQLLQSSIIIKKFHFVHPGLGKKEEKLRLIIFLAFTWIFFGFFFVGMIGHMILATEDEMMAERIENATGIVQTIVILIPQMIYCVVMEELEKLGNRLCSEKFGKPRILIDEIKYMNKFVFFHYIFMFTTTSFTFVSYYIRKVNCHGRKILMDNRFTCGLMCPLWYPFEVNNSVVEFILAIGIWVASIIIIPYGVAVVRGLVQYPRLITARLIDLKREVDRIHDVQAEDFSRRFKYITDYYAEILECVKITNNTVGYCHIVDFSMTTCLMALMVYSLLAGTFDLGALLGMLMFQSVTCMAGQSLEDKHDKFVQAIRNIPWWEMSPEMKSRYKIILMKINEPIFFQSKPLVKFNNIYLLSILRGAYRFAMFLKNSSTDVEK